MSECCRKTGTRIRCGSGAGAAVRGICDEIMHAGCGSLTVNTLPDCLLLHLLCPAVI